MKLFTWLGDGIFMVLVGILLLIKRIRYGILILSSFLISSLFVQILKRSVFHEFKRPVAWFHDLGLDIYRIPGIEYYSLNSFPSGHTTTAFAMFFGLSFFVKSNSLKILFLILAIITGFSRIYLSQHFIEDVLGGSVLGVIIVVIVHIYIENQKYGWLNENIISLLSKKNDKA